MRRAGHVVAIHVGDPEIKRLVRAAATYEYIAVAFAKPRTRQRAAKRDVGHDTGTVSAHLGIVKMVPDKPGLAYVAPEEEPFIANATTAGATIRKCIAGIVHTFDRAVTITAARAACTRRKIKCGGAFFLKISGKSAVFQAKCRSGLVIFGELADLCLDPRSFDKRFAHKKPASNQPDNDQDNSQFQQRKANTENRR